MKNPKRKGAVFEREVKHFLENKNYFVMRSAASLSPFDLAAMNKEKLLLIQCKSNCKPSKNEVEEIKNFNNYPLDCIVEKLICIKKNRCKDIEIIKI